MRHFRVISLLLCSVFLSPCMVVSQPLSPAPFEKAVKAGELADESIDEASGMAPSRLRDDVLWVINDSGNGPRFFAVDPGGKALASFRLKGARNRDWEDMASYVSGDRSYLLIADIGDNDAERESCGLYIVEEPDLKKPGVAGEAEVFRHIRFVYEDGPRDCESVAVDVENRRVLLLSKRYEIPIVYALSIEGPDDGRVLTAVRVGEVPHITPPTPRQILDDPIYGIYSSRNTAMDIDPSGRHAVILTYKNVYWFQRENGETWEDVLSKPPMRMDLPVLSQAEAVCFSRDGASLYVTSEKRPAPLYRFMMKAGGREKGVSERSE